MSNKKTTRDQFKEMVTYLMEEGTDNEIIEGYTDTFMLIHNEPKMAQRIKELTEENQLQKLQLEAKRSSWIADSENRENIMLKNQLIEKQKRIEELSKFIMNMNLFDEYCKWKDTEL